MLSLPTFVFIRQLIGALEQDEQARRQRLGRLLGEDQLHLQGGEKEEQVSQSLWVHPERPEEGLAGKTERAPPPG